MKKLLFVLAFAFIGQQAFTQTVIVTLYNDNTCSSSQVELTISTHVGKYLVAIVNGKTYTSPQKLIIL